MGGFFGNVDAELQTRWNQLATFYPFFRGHAHLDAKRREPWLFGDVHALCLHRLSAHMLPRASLSSDRSSNCQLPQVVFIIDLEHAATLAVMEAVIQELHHTSMTHIPA